jgi:hypothetical protein
VQELRKAAEEAMRVLGLDPSLFSEMPQTVAAMQERMSQLKISLLEKRSRALKLLGEEGGVINASDEVSYLRMLTAEVEQLEARLKVLQNSTVQAAFNARSVWEELGDAPELPRDAAAIKFSSATEPAVVPEEQRCMIDSSAAAAVVASLATWKECRAAAVSEVQQLHQQLRAFGSQDAVEAFLAENGTVHRGHRRACRLKLDELLKDVRAAEASTLQQIQHLYDETGLGTAAFKVFVASLERAESKEVRARMLAREIKRLEQYLDSVKEILGPLRELKFLVSAAVAFEANVQAGKARFSGNSLHFLEEEKFRRRFGHRYPELRDGLIEAIASWEARQSQKFVYHGLELCEGLTNIQGISLALVRVPGDLSVMGEVVKLLNIVDSGPPPPLPRSSVPTAKHPSPSSSRPSSAKSDPRSSCSMPRPLSRTPPP